MEILRQILLLCWRIAFLQALSKFGSLKPSNHCMSHNLLSLPVAIRLGAIGIG